jgi:hypothetical protein
MAMRTITARGTTYANVRDCADHSRRTSCRRRRNALNNLRTGLAQFLDALAPEHEVTIVSTGRHVRIRIPPTTDRKAGGLYEFINTSNSLPEKMKAIGDRLARDFASAQTKYDVAYVTDSPEVQRVSVGVSREGVMLEMSNTRTR